MEFPLDERLAQIGHRIDDQFGQAAVQDSRLLPNSVILEQITILSLALRARRAHVLLPLRAWTIGEGVQNLFEFHSSRDREPPVFEVVSRHDGEPGAAAAAIVVHAMRRHLAELRANGAQDFALRLYDSHHAYHVAGVVQRDREVVSPRIEFEPSTHDDVPQQHQRTLARDVQVAGKNAIGSHHGRLMPMTTLAQYNLLYLEFPGGFGLLNGHARELRIVVPQAVIDAVITGKLARHRPTDARRFENDGEGHRVLGPRQDFACVMNQQDVCAFLVPGGLDGQTGLVADLFVEKDDIVTDCAGVHARRGAGPELEHGALIVDFLGSDAHLHAEELADLARQQRIVHTHGTSLRAATATWATARGFKNTT